MLVATSVTVNFIMVCVLLYSPDEDGWVLSSGPGCAYPRPPAPPHPSTGNIPCRFDRSLITYPTTPACYPPGPHPYPPLPRTTLRLICNVLLILPRVYGYLRNGRTSKTKHWAISFFTHIPASFNVIDEQYKQASAKPDFVPGAEEMAED